MSDDCGCYPRVGENTTGREPELEKEDLHAIYSPGAVRLYGRPATTEKDGAKSKGNSQPEWSNNVALKIVVSPKDPNETIDTETVWSMSADIEAFAKIMSLGVIYGYSFEGHCYKLPKPKIMFLPVTPRQIVNGDCGYNPALGFAVWVVDKEKRCVALDMESGEIEEIILDENKPGSRSPMTYAQTMSLAPSRLRDT